MTDFLLRAQAKYLMKPALALVTHQPLLARMFALHLWLAERMPRGVAVTRTQFGGVPGRLFTPKGVSGPPKLLFLHGGGFTIGSSGTHASLTARLAKEAGVVAFSADYRLAPKHRFPAAQDDALAAYDALAALGPVAVAGDSAGGNLAAYLCTKRRPAAAALMSPLVDVTRLDRDVDFSAEMVIPQAWPKRTYPLLGVPDEGDPRLSPIQTITPGTPMLVHVGAEEALRWDADALADTAGAQVEHFPRMPHDWQLFGSWNATARRSIAGLGAFVRTHL